MTEAYWNEGIKIVIVKTFYNSAEAHIYKGRLKEFGIESFISNILTAPSIIPDPTGGIYLNVKETDYFEAKEICDQIDREQNQPQESDFRDADLGDIQYEKELFEREQRLNKNRVPFNGYQIIILILLIVLILLIIL